MKPFAMQSYHFLIAAVLAFLLGNYLADTFDIPTAISVLWYVLPSLIVTTFCAGMTDYYISTTKDKRKNPEKSSYALVGIAMSFLIVFVVGHGINTLFFFILNSVGRG